MYKILQPPVHERRSRDLENVGDDHYENSPSNVPRNEGGSKSKSSVIPARRLIKDFFGNHENNQELEDIVTSQSSQEDLEWIDDESFSRLSYNNFSVSPSSLQLNSPIISPFLVEPSGGVEGSKDLERVERVREDQVSSDVYEAVHDVVTRILSKNDKNGTGLVSKLKLLLGDL